MIVYSDPAEDGYGKGEVFPDGPVGARPATCSAAASPTTTSCPAIR